MTSTALHRPPLEDASSAEPRNPRALIIEVDESARSVLEVQLKRDGFDVTTARSGAEALRLTAPGRALPEVVVLATDLDGEDGYSVCAELRGDRRTSSIPVVMLAKAGEENPHALADVVGVTECLARPLYVRDVAVHVRLAIAPRDERGAVLLYATDLTPAHVLRAVLSSNREGQLELLSGRGVVVFKDGQVIDARVDGLSGTDALVRALVLTHGQYRLSFGPQRGETAFPFGLRDLVGQVFPRIARWERILMRSVPLDALLQVDFPQLAEALPDLPDAVNGVVRLFDARRDVRKVLLDSPLHETITLEVVTRLYLLGVLVPAAHELSDQSEPVPPVRLFEPKDSESTEVMEALFGATVPEITVPVEPKGMGLSPDWSLSPEYDGLPEDAVRSLRAFMTRTVVEGTDAPRGDLQQFADGAEMPLQPSLADALAQIAPTPPSARSVEAPKPWDHEVEAQFFDRSDPDLTPVHMSVSQAALGIAPVSKPSGLAEAVSSQRIAWAMAAVLLLAGLVVVLAQLGRGPVEPVDTSALATSARTIVLPPLEPVIVIHPTNPETEAALAAATALYEDNKVREALEMLEVIVVDDPSSADAWMMLGLARYDSGNGPGAKEAANTTLAIDPGMARAHLLLATAHMAAGQKDLGKAEVEKYLEQEPAGKFSDEARALLRR